MLDVSKSLHRFSDSSMDCNLVVTSIAIMYRLAIVGGISFFPVVLAIVLPARVPSTATTVEKTLLSVSLEFFAFPEYHKIPATFICLANLETLRGSPPAVRIGGTTQFSHLVLNNLSPLKICFRSGTAQHMMHI